MVGPHVNQFSVRFASVAGPRFRRRRGARGFGGRRHRIQFHTAQVPIIASRETPRTGTKRYLDAVSFCFSYTIHGLPRILH